MAAAVCTGCTSPEALRTRGGDSGADAGNRPDAVRMHEGSDPFWRTPVRIGDAHPPLGPANHARQLSEPRTQRRLVSTP
jgi:hypothetical protein